MARQQLQWRARPDGQWNYHSLVESSNAAAQVAHYTNKWGEVRTFDYRIVDPDSEEAIARAPEVEKVLPQRPVAYAFNFNRNQSN